VITYPDDEAVQREATDKGIEAPILIRDLVRIVELLNLRSQDFFDKNNVLGGSMALRSLGSPRFTVYDADFSLATEKKERTHEIKDQLAYEDADLVITPTQLAPGDKPGTLWVSRPTYDPIFTDLAPEDRTFKADFSFRGLVREGVERPLKVPYELEIWEEEPVMWMMDVHEVIAEKILGWCVNRLLKHYADLAFIAIASQPEIGLINVTSGELRSATADKLEVMKELQAEKYAAFESLNDLIQDLAQPANLSKQQWEALRYLKGRGDEFRPARLQAAIRERLVPLLRGKVTS